MNIPGEAVPIEGITKRSTARRTGTDERKNVSLACITCRKRKRKCDGCHPCARCVRASEECTYDQEDGRRDKRRRLEGDSVRVSHLLDSIRASDSIEQIRSEIDAHIAISQQYGQAWDPTREADIHTALPIQLEGSVSTQSVQKAPLETGPAYRTESTSGSSTEAFDEAFATVSVGAAGDRYDDNATQHKCMHCANLHPALQVQGHENECMCQYQMIPLQRKTKPHILLETQQPPPYPHCFSKWRDLPGSSAVKAAGFPSSIEQQQLQVYSKPEWAIMPLSYDDGSPLCRACTTYLSAAQAMLASGIPVGKVLGDRKPDVNLVFHKRAPTDLHNTSNWASALAASFIELEGPERLAMALLSYQLMQWMILPSAETYANLYECQRPTMVQRMVPHSLGIDFVHHPSVRDTLCRNPQIDYITPSIGNSINWSLSLDAAVEIHPASGALQATDKFEAHAIDLKNWSYSREYLELFVELRKGVREETTIV